MNPGDSATRQEVHLGGPGGEDITWPDQVAPRGRKASSTRKIKPQTSNLSKPPRPFALLPFLFFSSPCTYLPSLVPPPNSFSSA